MLPFFLIFEGRKPQARELVLIAVLVALNVAGRAVFFMLPRVQAGRCNDDPCGRGLWRGESPPPRGPHAFFPQNCFSQGSVDRRGQMFSMGIIGWLAGVLYRKGVLRRSRISLCIFGVIASTIIYGGIVNPASSNT